MNINCINNKIATANGVLQPIILRAIKEIYLNGNHQMTAIEVINHCITIDNNIPWKGRPAAICGAMRNAIKCGGRIIGDDRDFYEFTISFDGSTTNLEIKSTRRIISKDIENRIILEEKKISENKIVDLKEKNSTSNNHIVFLIPCSSSKISKEELEDKPFDINNLEFNSELGIFRKELIRKLKISDNSNTHKREKKVKKNKKTKIEVINIKNEFNFNKTAQAHKIYSKGKLYYNNSSDSINWTQKEKEKIYIISALFGIIRADNYIPLYDLAMTDEIDSNKNYAQGFWKGKLDSIIEKLKYDGYIIYNILSSPYNFCINNQHFTVIPNINWKDNYGHDKGVWLKENL